MKTKVAIVAGSASRDRAPYKDKTWELWGLNEMTYPGRIDVYWEMHPMSVQSDKDLDWLRKCRTPVYVLDKADAALHGVQNPIEYPYDEIVKQSWAIKYFTCSMAYQIAFAIHKGYKAIALYGLRMDMGSPRERTIESACIQYWLGIAVGKGIEVVWDENPAYQRLRYGYDYWDEIENIDNWLYKLNAHTIYRLGGKHLKIGGDK
jgi:hypothetical protein